RVAIVAVAVALLPVQAAPGIAPGDSPAADDVFYMYMPIAWRDSDLDTYRFGDFGGMIDALPYLQELGITAVWMNPIFPSPAYHGYQHDAADQISQWFGTEADFLDFVAAAHAQGIKVFIDFVVYGISQNSIWFQDSYSNPASPYDDYLAYTNAANTTYLGYSFTTWNSDTVGFIHWNLNNADVTTMITDWGRHWLDPDDDGDPSDGIDGYRLDHVSAWHPEESPWGYHLDWWMAWKSELLTVNPDVFTFAEQADWGSHGQDLLPAFDAAMTKPFEFAARDAVASEQAAGLYNEMASTLASLPPGKTYLATIGDHDVDRITSIIGGSLNKAKAAAAVLLTQPFPPVIYYGDEIGMLGVKANYGSDANDIPMREPFKWNAVAGPPMSNYFLLNPQAYNNRYSQDNDGRSVEEQEGVPGSLLETYRTLISVRRTHPALRYGTYHQVPNSGSRVWTFLRHDADNETLLAAINLRGLARAPSLDLSNATIPGGATTVQDVITGEFLPDLTQLNQSAYSVSLPAYEFKILALDVIPVEQEPTPGNYDGLDIPQDLGTAHLVALQDNATGLGDNISEADALYLRSAPDGLRIGVTGNVNSNGSGFVLLFDTVPGGQNALITSGFPTPPNAIPSLDGTTMDAGFEPDILLFVNAWSGQFYADRFTLPTGSLGVKRYVGGADIGVADGTLSGGSNPYGMKLGLDNSNTAGVTDTDASGAATATSGLEGLLPYEDVNLDPASESVKVMVMMVRPTGEVGNQLLPGLGGGYANLGFSPDLNDIPGQQFAEVSLLIAGDYDGDRDVDLGDYSFFDDCLTGPDPAGPLTPGCEAFDFDTDVDVDLTDYGEFCRALVTY
ncbi:MAG: alpha-amylase family glycosyl hydrolase, partial [Planctomycetota bacterium]